jgi:hypothetical protein
VKLFQLRVSGRRSWVDGVWTMASKRLFRTAEGAEAYKPEFRKVCTTDRHEHDLTTLMDDESFKCDVAELELADGD